jgi:hypothetical protein
MALHAWFCLFADWKRGAVRIAPEVVRIVASTHQPERPDTAMALGFYFTPSGFTPAKYDDALARLEAAGAGAPAGRLYHAALESDGLIQVFDVWDSQESFEAFGATLLPIMEEIGADPGQPQVAPVRNIIVG